MNNEYRIWSNKKAAPSFYAIYYSKIHSVCKKNGYTLVLHGSMQRDLDLIAIPWAQGAIESNKLIEKICEVSGTMNIPHHKTRKYSIKPHGRKAYSLTWDGTLGATPYIDISIMPITKREH